MPHPTASVIPSSIIRGKPITRAEAWVTFGILVFPILGVFYPPETYFAPQDFTVDGAVRDIGIPFGRYFNLLIIMWLVFFTMKNQLLMLRALRRVWLPIAFVAWMTCTAYFTVDPMASFNRSMRTMIMVVFAGYMIERYPTAQILRFLVLAGGVLVASSAFAAIALPQYGLTKLLGYEGAWRGATIHKNSLGAAMAALILHSYFGLHFRSVRPLLGYSVMFSALIVMILSKSSTSILMVIIGFGIYFLAQFIMRLRPVSAKFIVIFVLMLLFPFLFILKNYTGEFLSLVGRDPNLTGRTDIWSLIWGFIQARPWFGYGNNFWATDSAMRDYIWLTLQWAAPHAHNTFLDIWFQTGVIGVAIFSCIVASSLLKTVVLLLSNQSRYNLIWPVVILTLLIRGFSETQFVEPGAGVWFSFTLAFAALSKMVRPERAVPKVETQPIPGSERG